MILPKLFTQDNKTVGLYVRVCRHLLDTRKPS